MARNRKRANQRRPRQPAEGADARDAGLPTATERSFAREHDHEIEDNGSADPLKQAAPDAELAEEQLELGRPDEPESGDEADEEEFEQEVEESIATAGGGGGGGGRAPSRFAMPTAAATMVGRRRRGSHPGQGARSRRERTCSRGSSGSCREAGASCNEYSGPIVVR